MGARRALSGAVVALCVLSQVATAAHFVMVRHSFCALHGEAVDVDATTPAQHRAVRLAHVESVAADSHEDGGLDTHNHCALAGDRAGKIALPPAASAHAPGALLADRARAYDDAVRFASARLLLLAPKTSPPA